MRVNSELQYGRKERDPRLDSPHLNDWGKSRDPNGVPDRSPPVSVSVVAYAVQGHQRAHSMHSPPGLLGGLQIQA